MRRVCAGQVVCTYYAHYECMLIETRFWTTSFGHVTLTGSADNSLTMAARSDVTNSSHYPETIGLCPLRSRVIGHGESWSALTSLPLSYDDKMAAVCVCACACVCVCVGVCVGV